MVQVDSRHEDYWHRCRLWRRLRSSADRSCGRSRLNSPQNHRRPWCSARNHRCRVSLVPCRLPSGISTNEPTLRWYCSGSKPSTIRQAQPQARFRWVSGLLFIGDCKAPPGVSESQPRGRCCIDRCRSRHGWPEESCLTVLVLLIPSVYSRMVRVATDRAHPLVDGADHFSRPLVLPSAETNTGGKRVRGRAASEKNPSP